MEAVDRLHAPLGCYFAGSLGTNTIGGRDVAQPAVTSDTARSTAHRSEQILRVGISWNLLRRWSRAEPCVEAKIFRTFFSADFHLCHYVVSVGAPSVRLTEGSRTPPQAPRGRSGNPEGRAVLTPRQRATYDLPPLRGTVMPHTRRSADTGRLAERGREADHTARCRGYLAPAPHCGAGSLRLRVARRGVIHFSVVAAGRPIRRSRFRETRSGSATGAGERTRPRAGDSMIQDGIRRRRGRPRRAAGRAGRRSSRSWTRG